MEELYNEGKTKSIGLSNFNVQQIQDVIDNSTVKPVMMQMEVNVYLQNVELVDFCQKNGISVVGYAPLGASDRAWYLAISKSFLSA
jgi:alcohol dehydrogenase (NADP+)